MEIDISADEVRVSVTGEWTIYTAAECTATLRDALQEPRALTLDLSAVTEFDSAGVQLLLMLQRLQHNHEKSITLKGVSPAVREVLSCLRIDLNGRIA